MLPQQLIFDWAQPVDPEFDNFIAGGNDEVVAHLRAFAMRAPSADAIATPSILLWGAPGSGRTHLLRATLAEANLAGRTATLLHPDAIPHAADRDALYAVDDVDRLAPGAQGDLFTLYNACRDAGAQLLLTAGLPASMAPLRDDLRTRIGAGLVLEVRPLDDTEKPFALAAYAREQGFRLSADVIGYLLTRGRRDMGALLAYLRALDRYSLATKRPVTVPLVRELLGPSLQPPASIAPDDEPATDRPSGSPRAANPE